MDTSFCVVHKYNECNHSDKEQDNDNDVDNKLSTIVKYYEANIGLLVPTTATILKDLVETFSEDLIKKAIDIACIRNARNMSYIQGILKDWERKGYKTLADIENEKKEVKSNLEEVWSLKEKKSK